MKIWKMIGCLGLLVVIICGCVALGNPTKVAAQENTEPQEQEKEEDEQEAPEDTQAPQAQPDSTTTVNKTYSTGLSFRSNGDGTCAVAGIGTCTAACILIPPQSPAGDTVTEILAGAFAGSVATTDQLVRVMYHKAGVKLVDCIKMITST